MTSDNDTTLIDAVLRDHDQIHVEHEPVTPTSEGTSQLIELFSRQLSTHEVSSSRSPEDTHAEQESNNQPTPVTIHTVHNEHETIEEWLLQLATTPGSLAGQMSFEDGRLRQKKFLEDTLQNDKGVYRLKNLVELGIEHKVVLLDGFSYTETWGLEANLYIIIKGTQCTARTAAALLGLTCRQDAVGICSHLTQNDIDTYKSSQGQKLPDDVHRLVSVRPRGKNTIMTPKMGLEIITPIRKKFPHLSSQLDISGCSIEFHEYGPHNEHFGATTIKQILQNKFSKSYRVDEFLAKSTLLEESDYEMALKKSGLHVNSMISCVKLAQKHASYFSF